MLSISNKPFILSTSNSNNDVCLSTTNDYEPLLRSWFAEVLIFFAETFHVSELHILKTQWMVEGIAYYNCNNIFGFLRVNCEQSKLLRVNCELFLYPKQHYWVGLNSWNRPGNDK